MSGQGWTIARVARESGVSEKTVRRRIERGEMPAFRIPRGRAYEWRVDPAGLGLNHTEAVADGVAAGRTPIDDPDAAWRPLLELLREKDRQIIELANQLGALQERARLLEDELRSLGDGSLPETRRSWVRRLLR